MNKIPAGIKKKFNQYTPFERAVWTACASIPKGQFRTYGWIAKRIGRPKASRAVGAALGRNPFAPVIPCHRVVRADGGMGGYSARGGVAKKRRLLLIEGALIKSSVA
jgi:methylated-DNA-[protein]-cysteine S-methyltransferase